MGVAKPKPIFPTAYVAVVIGINYTGLEFRSLRGAEADARAMAAVLVASGYEVTMLLGRSATRQSIMDTITRLRSAAGLGGVLLVYFSGHATRLTDIAQQKTTHLIPVDAVPVDAGRSASATTTIALDDLARHFADGVGYGLLILDCAHAGYAQFYDVHSTEHGRVVMAASRADELSRELAFDGKIRGAFTYWIEDYWKKTTEAFDAASLFAGVARALAVTGMSEPVMTGIQIGSVALRPALPAVEQAVNQQATTSPATDVVFVIREELLTGLVRRDLVDLLVKVFPKHSDLAELTDYYLEKPLDSIPLDAESRDTETLFRNVVGWCLVNQGNFLGRLLSGAIEQRPHNDELRQMVESLSKQQ